MHKAGLKGSNFQYKTRQWFPQGAMLYGLPGGRGQVPETGVAGRARIIWPLDKLLICLGLRGRVKIGRRVGRVFFGPRVT
ncbi:hypothetical protein SBA6_480036 [Candidatus Sulfopaludibacter sp. SbA6]|nr:hypothetical protein SBA6_480036 [Candidatus Sulfopaludibacter sp. SbA6]